jgi:hypothetical protein
MKPIGQNCHLQPLGDGKIIVTSRNTGFWMIDGQYAGPGPFEVVRSVNNPDRVIVPLTSESDITDIVTPFVPPPEPPVLTFQISLRTTWQVVEYVGESFENTVGPFDLVDFWIQGGAPGEDINVSFEGSYTSDPPVGPFAMNPAIFEGAVAQINSEYVFRYELVGLKLFVADVSTSPTVWTPLTAGSYEVRWDVYRDSDFTAPGSYSFESSHTEGPFQMDGSEDRNDPDTWPSVSSALSWNVGGNIAAFDTINFRNVTFHLV